MRCAALIGIMSILVGCGVSPQDPIRSTRVQDTFQAAGSSTEQARKLASKALEQIEEAKTSDAKFEKARRGIKDLSSHYFFSRGWGYLILARSCYLGSVQKEPLLNWWVSALTEIQEKGDWDEGGEKLLHRAQTLVRSFSDPRDQRRVMAEVLGALSTDFDEAVPTRFNGPRNPLIDKVERLALNASMKMRRAKDYDEAARLFDQTLGEIRTLMRQSGE